MLQCPLGIDDPDDCINQDHAHLLTTNHPHVRILAQQQHAYEILLAAAEINLNDSAATVKPKITKRVN